MKRIFLMFSLMFILLSGISYAQEDFLHITANLDDGKIIIDSSYEHGLGSEIDNLIEEIDNQYIFSFSYRPDREIDFSFKLVLPENAIISESNDVLLLTRPAEISTDGRNIFIEWSMTSSEEITLFTKYEAREEDSTLLIGLLIFLIVVIFLLGYKSSGFNKNKFVDKTISPDEKELLKIIRKKKEINQDELRREVGWSKTKTSKIVRNLESKELIEKKPYKKTNRLSLK